MMRRYLVFTVILLFWGPMARELPAQFISRAPLHKDPRISREYYPLNEFEIYENYAIASYRDYDPETEERTYDPFGTYLIDGVEVFKMEEYRTISPFKGSRLFKSALNRTFFQNLMISTDQYKGWSTRFIIGDAVSARFNPWTMDITRMNGIRWDTSSRKNQLTMVTSRISSPLLSSGNMEKFFSTYLYGGYWESRIGDILRFSASYTSTHRNDSLSKNGSFRKGTIPTTIIGSRNIYLIFTDDSPEDGFGAAIYAVEVYVNGQKMDLMPKVWRVPQVLGFVQEIQPEDLSHLRRYQSWLQNAVTFDRLFRTGGIVEKQGIPILDAGNRHLEASGTDVLIYQYEVPVETEQVRFRALVANDYNIDIGSGLGWHGVAGRVWGDWHTVRRSPGNVQDRSNVKWVSFDYGFPTGLVVYGMDLSARLLGFDWHMGYNNSVNYYQFPFNGGNGSEEREAAYFLSVLRKIGSWEWGAEFFNVSPEYTTAFPFWHETAQKIRYFDLVDDNDDRDEWPDSWEHWDPLDPGYYSIGSEIADTAPLRAKENLAPPPGGAIGFGVYPGLDEDQDGVVDTNVNANRYPDYVEPFLMYYVEPDEFVYGDDFNNNGIVDARENDNRPDYPYDIDQKGGHSFLSFVPRSDLRVTFGRYDIRQIAGEGRNAATYTEVEYSKRWLDVGELQVNYLAKRIRDNVANPVYQVIIDPLAPGNFSVQIRPDPLSLRNSLMNLAFLETKLTYIPNLNVRNDLRVEINSQRESSFQGGGNVRSWAWVSKIDYTWKWGDLRVMPMFKFMRQKTTSYVSEAPVANDYYVVPILRADYALSPNTTVRGGVQGLSFLKYRYRNLAFRPEDFDSKNWIIVLQNRSNYTGYNMSINFGYKVNFTDFIGLKEAGQKIKSRRISEFFVQVRVD